MAAYTEGVGHPPRDSGKPVEMLISLAHYSVDLEGSFVLIHTQPTYSSFIVFMLVLFADLIPGFNGYPTK